ncbi:DUF2599 domain-containing protein [Paenibacillus faecalis]|uniref:DUF2599 domain-containing protein n=1 Tax=Paenibacillus faecalis TaxID=2079532 RepID=UPI000D10769E|nr:DUF2599 domain-containing protein [Paenibacillus faecalis]
MKLGYLRKAVFFMLGVFILSLGTTVVQASDASFKDSDSSKVEVEIFVNSNGEGFAENIVFDDGTRLSDYDYSVKYVPMLLSSFYPIQEYFDYAAWITRDGVISLSLDPVEKVRKNKSEKDAAWGVLSSPTDGFGSHANWNNTQVMKWQYDCHYWFASNKDYWNLEPHRTASSYIEVVTAACNP